MTQSAKEQPDRKAASIAAQSSQSTSIAANPSAAILQVRDLGVTFHTQSGEVKALRGVSFDLQKGEILAIVGESGSGKTVLSKAILQLHKQNATYEKGSQILFEGRNILTLSPKDLRKVRGDRIAMVFQDAMTSLDPTMTIEKQIMETLRIHQNLTGQAARDKVRELLSLVEIPDVEARMKCYPHQLSGGMRQRVMIAMALSCNPDILLADEPTTALDVTIQAQILDLLRDLRRKMGMSIIIVTHDLSVAAGFADRIMVMYAGHILEAGTAAEIFGCAAHPYTWALLQAVPGEYMQRRSMLAEIKGTPPDMRLPLQYCPFAARCPYAMHICHTTPPQESTISPTHRLSCWLQHPLAPHVTPPLGSRGVQI